MKFSITIDGTNCTSVCSRGENILVSMARSNVNRIPSGCHGGGCGVCKIRILSGEYKTGRMNRDVLPLEDEQKGYSLACKTFAEGNLEIVVVGRMKKFY